MVLETESSTSGAQPEQVLGEGPFPVSVSMGPSTEGARIWEESQVSCESTNPIKGLHLHDLI